MIIGDILKSIKSRVGSIFPSSNNGSFVYRALEPLKKIIPKGQPLLGHLAGYRYCGPFNDLSNGAPKNGLDSLCQQHDNAYDQAFKAPDKQQSQQLERQADNDLLGSLKQYQPSGITEHLGKWLAQGAIGGKVGIENAVRRIGSVF